MLSCWNANPRLRPTFTDLMLSLTNQPALASDRHSHGGRRPALDSTSHQPVLDVPAQSQSLSTPFPHKSQLLQPVSRVHNVRREHDIDDDDQEDECSL